MNVADIAREQQAARRKRLAFLVAALVACLSICGISTYQAVKLLAGGKRAIIASEEEEHATPSLAAGRETVQVQDAVEVLRSIKKSESQTAHPAGSSDKNSTDSSWFSFNRSQDKVAGGSNGKGSSDGGMRMDALPSGPEIPTRSAIVIHAEDGTELVPTNHPAVPTFPRTISLPSDRPGEEATEYTLVGLGTRSVSFLQISVYVVGLYIATSDVAGVQSRLVKKVNPLATTLVPGERDQLLSKLEGKTDDAERVWQEAFFPARMLLRITPVRDTNFHHLCDGFVRAITARTPPEQAKGDQVFKEAVREFKQVFRRGNVPKTSELLLCRDAQGRLSIIYRDAKGSGRREAIGGVVDDRISRALWLNYLTGKVASEPARLSIVKGVMEFVERPVGTVAGQVV